MTTIRSFIAVALLSAVCLHSTPTLAEIDDLNLPVMGDSTSGLVSLAKERKLGENWLKSLRRQAPEYNDPLLTSYFERLVFRMAPYSDIQEKSFRFVVINDNQLNAFAVPGGIVGINAGLFLYSENEGEFASVIAHELAHLSQRHFARNLERSQRTQSLALAGLIASIAAAAAGNGEAAMAGMATTQAAAIQSQLAYSRQFEREADRIGLNTLVEAGFDPEAMPEMFESMMRSSQYAGRRIPEYLTTHPLTENRVADARNRAQQYPRAAKSDSVEFFLVKARVRKHYAASTAAAAEMFQDEVDSERTDNLDASRYGLTITLIEQGRISDARKALAPLQEKHPNLPAVVIAQSDIYNATDKFPESLALLEKRLARTPGNYPLLYQQADTYYKMKRYDDAKQTLRGLTHDRPEDPWLWYMLAETSGLAGDLFELHRARGEYLQLSGRPKEAIKQMELALKRGGSESFQRSALIEQRIEEIRQSQEKLEL